MASVRLLRDTHRECDLTSGSTTVLVLESTDGLAVGDKVQGPGVPDGATIATLAATSFTLSAAATLSTGASLHFIGQMANVGTTGNNTHASVPVPDDADALSFEFEVTAVGTTVTPKFQGSNDGPDVADASSDFFDLAVLPPAAAAETTTPAAVTTVSVNEYTAESVRRPVRKVRLVTSANTGCTYEADAYGIIRGD
jgi:hypothetical protein